METIEGIDLTNTVDLISQAALESQYVKFENKTLVKSEAKIKKYGDITVISPLEKLKSNDRTNSDDNYITYDNGKGEGIGLDLYIKNPESENFKKISGSSVVTPAEYDPTTNLYTVVKKNVYNMVLYVSQDEKPAGIIEYLVTPMSPQIEEKRYALENLSYHSYVDLSKINTGYCGITAWEFKYNVNNDKKFVLNIKFERYPRSGETFKDLKLTFIPYDKNGIRTDKKHTVQYTGELDNNYEITGEPENDNNVLGFLTRNTVYTVKVSYKSVIEETESEIYITKDYWIVTSEKFNDLYPSSEESKYKKNYIEIYSNLVSSNFKPDPNTNEAKMLNAITIKPTITITNPEGIEDKISINVTSRSSDLKGTILSKNYPINGIFKMYNEITNTIESEFIPKIELDSQIVGLELNEGELSLNVSCNINSNIESKGTEINIEPYEYYNDSYSDFDYKLKLGEKNTIITKVSYKSLYKAKSQDKADITFGGIFESFCNKIIPTKYNISTERQVGFSLSSESANGNQYVFVSKINNPGNRVILNYRHDTTETQTLASGIENKYLRLNFNNIPSDYFGFENCYFLIGGGSETYEGICEQGGAYYNTNINITKQDEFENALDDDKFINGNPIRVWINDGANNPVLIGTIIIPIENRTSPNLSVYDIYPKLRKLINDKGLNFKRVYENGPKTLNNVYFRDSANQAYVTLNAYNDDEDTNAKLNFTFKPNGFSLTQNFPIAFQINKNAEIKITQEIKLASVIDFSKISQTNVKNIHVSSVFQQQYYDEEGKTDGTTNEINVEGADYYCIDNNGNLLDKNKIYTQWMTEVGNDVIILHNNIPIFTCLTKDDQKYRYQFSYNYAMLWNYYGQYRRSSIDFSDIYSVKDISKEDNSCSNEANPSIIV